MILISLDQNACLIIKVCLEKIPEKIARNTVRMGIPVIELPYMVQIIRFTEMSTHLSVNVGQWVTISGMENAGNEIIKEILGTGTGRQSSSYMLSMMVETM